MQKLAHDNGLSGLLVGSSPLAMSLSLGAKSPTKSPTGTGTHQPSSAASSTVITSPGLPDPYSRPTTRGANPHRLGSARPASTSGASASGSVPATTAAQHLGASGSGGTQTFLQRTRERQVPPLLLWADFYIFFSRILTLIKSSKNKQDVPVCKV